ncbi:hypothetical protein VM98_25285 [Streptomyces rubellomurinus subsp. indigoferus]|nr:hypothetical protein VM98_25285 [Streptomyces rubellomurinus subsp. indigoferus]
MSELENEIEQLRQFRAEAEAAADAVETAWRIAGLPSTPNVMPIVQGRGLPKGPHVSLGGCHAQTALALARYLTAHARCTGRLVDGESHRLLAKMLRDLDADPVVSDGLYVVRREMSA